MGGITAGLLADYSGRPASTCAGMLVVAIPMLFVYQQAGRQCPLVWNDKGGCYSVHVGLLMILGLLVNGPYALITTAVSADLGTHSCLQVRNLLNTSYYLVVK